MKARYIVTYDISDPRRLRRVFKTMMGAGDHLQLSVFRCDLTERQREALVSNLGEIIKPTEDQVLLIELGPSDGHVAERIRALGRVYQEARRVPLVV